ncbi:MAG: hypothetical protein H7210_14570 [Pyrinomonadaceae bacterium]|nr:hypothetical protein [Phycisphaerales bacterium]
MPDLVEYTGSFAVTDLLDAACRLAGMLAELGCTHLQLAVNGEAARLCWARETDLPGELLIALNSPDGQSGVATVLTLHDARGGLIVELRRSDTTVAWRTTDRSAAVAIGPSPA